MRIPFYNTAYNAVNNLHMHTCIKLQTMDVVVLHMHKRLHNAHKCTHGHTALVHGFVVNG